MLTRIDSFIGQSAKVHPDGSAIGFGNISLNYSQFDRMVSETAAGLMDMGLKRRDRVGIWLGKQLETAAGLFGATRADGVMVPINPALKHKQVSHILADCDVRFLITNQARLDQLVDELPSLPALEAIILTDQKDGKDHPHSVPVTTWADLTARGQWALDDNNWVIPGRAIDSDIAAILYTSGSTGRPKGVVLSHRNMMVGAQSVATYLGNTPKDRLLAALPLSFDYGLSQLTTAFHVGAHVQLMDYLLPRDVIRQAERHHITGLAGVPPLWIHLARLEWPESLRKHLRYITNSGGAMPQKLVQALRDNLPKTEIFLMYGLTEAFRSTYLPPSLIDAKPGSMGKAIPNAEVMVVNADGQPCAPGEPGELVHRGPLVSLGYWNDPERTNIRFKPAPGQPRGLVNPELAVWSGDKVKMDDEGFLYFVGRDDEMIKTSGYRVSPGEVEEIIHDSHLVGEVAAFGRPDEEKGQTIVAFVSPLDGQAAVDVDALLAHCRAEMPAFMVPSDFIELDALPRNPNGKLDRAGLAARLTS